MGYLVVSIVLIALLSPSRMAAGETLATAEIPITATVLNYAKCKTNPNTLNFGNISGAVGSYEATDIFTVESNHKVNIKVEATKLKLLGGTDTIKTEYKVREGANSFVEATTTTAPGNIIDTITQEGVSNKTYNIDGKATIESISGQRAGDYRATITITISSGNHGGSR
jgi:hypothetical protein